MGLARLVRLSKDRPEPIPSPTLAITYRPKPTRLINWAGPNRAIYQKFVKYNKFEALNSGLGLALGFLSLNPSPAHNHPYPTSVPICMGLTDARPESFVIEGFEFGEVQNELNTWDPKVPVWKTWRPPSPSP